jgi:hypothetical protein
MASESSNETQFLTEHEVVRLVAVVADRWDKWSSEYERSRSSLYRLLGSIFEIGSALESERSNLEHLKPLLQGRPDVRASKRWNFKDKSAFELLLTLHLGLTPENASRKSNWKRTLEVAQQESVEPTEAAFVDWITAAGGEEAARRNRKPNEQSFNLDDFAEGLPDVAADGAAEFSLSDGTELMHGLSVALVQVDKVEGNRAQGRILGSVTRKRVVETVAQTLARQWKREFRKEAMAFGNQKVRQREGGPFAPPPPEGVHYDHDTLAEEQRERRLNSRPGKRRRTQKMQFELAAEGKGKGKLPISEHGADGDRGAPERDSFGVNPPEAVEPVALKPTPEAASDASDVAADKAGADVADALSVERAVPGTEEEEVDYFARMLEDG